MLSNVHLTNQDNWNERWIFIFASDLVAILKTSVAQAAMENKDKVKSSYVNCAIVQIQK